jgi:DNA-directed RNA polymerase subunit RPC12/RpoP
MVCEFCDSSFDVETLKQLDETLPKEEGTPKWELPHEEWPQEERDGMLVYSCQSCGGEIIADQTLGATFCPYCGNPAIMTKQFSGALRPEYIIPFQKNQEQAKAALKAHFRKKRLLPKVFSQENHLDKIQGVYVPFWLFDCDVKGQGRYETTRVRHWSDSKYRYTETSHFLVDRSGTVLFDRVPVDGSTKMPDDLMESVEPFDYKQLAPFQTAYMSGYLADKYDVDANASASRAYERIRKNTEMLLKETVKGYQSVQTKSSQVNIVGGGSHYALLPVWILNTKWKDKSFVFAMNGQTGKLVGDLPLDIGAFFRYFAGIGLSTAVIAFLVIQFIL